MLAPLKILSGAVGNRIVKLQEFGRGYHVKAPSLTSEPCRHLLLFTYYFLLFTTYALRARVRRPSAPSRRATMTSKIPEKIIVSPKSQTSAKAPSPGLAKT